MSENDKKKVEEEPGVAEAKALLEKLQKQRDPDFPIQDQEIVDPKVLQKMQKSLVELGDTAVWSVSSAKHGNGVLQLRDGNPGTFWQSDGVLPHSIDVALPKVSLVHYVAIFVSYAGDESYTPKKMIVRAGTHEGDLADVAAPTDLESPNGWIVIRCSDRSTSKDMPVWANMVSVSIVENHQNGRDTHVRGVKVFGPYMDPEYSSTEMLMSTGVQLR